MKIAILGYSGSGKSTLARQLADRFGAPALFLDTVHFLPGWKERGTAESRAIVADFLCHESWVIDGNYTNLCMRERLEQADIVLLLLFPRAVCLFRAWKRLRQFRGRTRDSMTADCPEKLDREFLWWILYKGRARAKRRQWRQIMADYPEKTRILKNARQVSAFLRRAGPIPHSPAL